jgi:hypothetical protein
LSCVAGEPLCWRGGQTIPVGVTEWNADPSAPMPNDTQGTTWMMAFTR